MDNRLSWLTKGSYLKDENGKYCTGCAMAPPFEVTEAAPLPLVTLANSLNSFMGLHFSQGRTVSVGPVDAFRAALDFGTQRRLPLSKGPATKPLSGSKGTFPQMIMQKID